MKKNYDAEYFEHKHFKDTTKYDAEYFKYKHLKYKTKYLNLKKQHGGQNDTTSSNSLTDSNHSNHSDKEDNKRIANTNNHFAIDLFENFDGASNLFSPISITYAISLVHLGALGKTDDQLTELFGHKFSTDDLQSIKTLFNNDIIKMISMILINNNYKINNEYLEMIKPLAMVIYKDFTNANMIAQKINKYISQNTNNMIKNVISDGDISSNDIFVIVNTVYFKSNWLTKFDPKLTSKMKFHKTNSDVVSMMHQKNSFNYYENSSVQVVELPYASGGFAMGIVLPKQYLQEENLAYSINNVPIISEPQLEEMINNLSYEDVDLYIPKFTQRKNLEIVPILRKMGVTYLFSKSDAELDIISDKAYVSRIIHEAVVIVDEEGTEASGATIIISKERSAPIRKSPKLFKADHAFIYYIRHVPSGIILFYGDYQGN